MARKTTKLCPVCGKEFKGTDGKITCSNACRTATSRMLAKGKKPEYWLMAKSKGQKMPLVFNGPIPKKEKPKQENLSATVKVITPTPESYDAPPLNPIIKDEAPKIPVLERGELTPEMFMFKLEHVDSFNELQLITKQIEKSNLRQREKDGLIKMAKQIYNERFNAH